MALSGLLVVDKPAGCTSHDVVARCRRLLSERRIGHGGTLDPDATGVLLVGVGRVTRLLRFLSELPKVYSGHIVLGSATDTLDSSGRVTGEWDMASVTADQVRDAAAGLTGPIRQVPPMVSAVQVGGRRLHELARQGLEVERPARSVTVERFDLEPSGPGRYDFEVVCSSGTYVRVLADDLGRALGGGAHLGSLRRVAIGPYGLDEAVPLEEASADRLLAPAQAVRCMETLVLGPEELVDAGHGRPLDPGRLGATGPGPWAVVDSSGDLVGVYERPASSSGSGGEGAEGLRAAVITRPATA